MSKVSHNSSHMITYYAMSHTIRGFRYPLLILELHVLANFCLPQ